jgi:polyisoprenoid-binding protein YceI
VFEKGKIRFEIRNAGLTVEGGFSDFEAIVKFSPQNPEATQIEGTAKVKSLETGIGLRNRHLQKQEFFHSEKFPVVSMRLLYLRQSGINYMGKFALSMKGVVREIQIPVSFDITKGLMSTRFAINRRDFGIGGNSWTMADMVQVYIDFDLIRK